MLLSDKCQTGSIYGVPDFASRVPSSLTLKVQIQTNVIPKAACEPGEIWNSLPGISVPAAAVTVFDLARDEKGRCIPISWATVKAAWRPSSSITAQLRSGAHMVPTSAIPRVSHEWCPHKSFPGERKKSLKSITIQKGPPWKTTCSLREATLGDVYGVTCSGSGNVPKTDQWHRLV